MSHPFQNDEHVRHSRSEILEITNPDGFCCPSCYSKNITSEQVKTAPKFQERESTADLFTCSECNTQWEVAYTIVYSMCIMKDPLDNFSYHSKPQIF